MNIEQRVMQVRQEIEKAQIARVAAGFTAEEVKLIAVTKNQEVEAIREAVDCGIVAIGENRVQEAAGKYTVLERNAEWHLIGHLQKNKVRNSVPIFDLIHSVDNESLAQEINRIAAREGKVQDILLQINIGDEATKFGFPPTDLKRMATFCSKLPNVRICGIMAIAPYCDDPETIRPLFRELYRLFTELKFAQLPNADIKWLSMGMTNDYRVAVEEGANMVRIGTAIFGARVK